MNNSGSFKFTAPAAANLKIVLFKALKDFSLPLEMTVWTAFKTIFMELPAVVTTV